MLWHFGVVVLVFALLRRAFDRAIRGGVPLKQQPLFTPLMWLGVILGPLLVLRMVLALWSGQGHWLMLVFLVALGLWIARVWRKASGDGDEGEDDT